MLFSMKATIRSTTTTGSADRMVGVDPDGKHFSNALIRLRSSLLADSV